MSSNPTKDPPQKEPTFDWDLIRRIKDMIRIKSAVYDVIPPAVETETFIIKLHNEILKTKPEDEFKFIEDRVEKWYESNRRRWIAQIEPRRIKTVIKKLSYALSSRNLTGITDEDLRLVREYVEILPELENLRESIAEVVYEMVLGPSPSTSRVGLNNLKRLLTHPEFDEICKKLGIKEIIDAAREKIEDLIEAVEKGTIKLPVKRVDAMVAEFMTYIKTKNYGKITPTMVRTILNNFDSISPQDRVKLKSTIMNMLNNPPMHGDVLIRNYMKIIEMPEFIELINRLGIKSLVD